jgi:hypothetical protein
VFSAAAGYERTRWGWQRADRPGRHVDRHVPVARLRPYAEAMLADLAAVGLCAAEAGVDADLCAGDPAGDAELAASPAAGGGAGLPVWRFPDIDTLPARDAARWCNVLGLHPFELWADPADRAALVWAWPPSQWVHTIDALDHRPPG